MTTDLQHNPYAARTFARVCRSLIICKGSAHVAATFAQSKNWNDVQHVVDHLKSIVAGMNTVDTPPTAAALDFSAAVRPLTVIGRLAGIRRVPAGVRILSALNGTVARFIGAGKPVPVSAGDLTGEVLFPKKVSGITIVTNELATIGTPTAENLLRDDLASACAQGIDEAFLDPANAGDDDTPAAVTSGVIALVSTGSTAAAIDADLRRLLLAVSAAGSTLQAAHWVMPPHVAIHLSGVRDDSGALAYPTVSALGGTLFGLPVVPAGNMPAAGSPASSQIVLIDASQIALADDGQAEIAVSKSAAFQLSDVPTNDASGTTATNMVSMFQTNSVAVRATRYLNWHLRRPYVAVLGAVAY